MTVALLQLRVPTATDSPAVRGLVERAGIFRLDEVDTAVEVFDDAVAAPGTDYWAIGAYEEDRLVGFATFGPVPCTVATWDLYWIVVDPECQRMGVGRRLLDHCETTVAAQAGRLLVAETSSRASYAQTRAFYAARGFVAEAAIADYYAPADGLVVFVKRLGAAVHGGPTHG